MKEVKGHKYLYLVRSVRDTEGTVRQEILDYYGRLDKKFDCRNCNYFRKSEETIFTGGSYLDEDREYCTKTEQAEIISEGFGIPQICNDFELADNTKEEVIKIWKVKREVEQSKSTDSLW